MAAADYPRQAGQPPIEQRVYSGLVSEPKYGRSHFESTAYRIRPRSGRQSEIVAVSNFSAIVTLPSFRMPHQFVSPGQNCDVRSDRTKPPIDLDLAIELPFLSEPPFEFCRVGLSVRMRASRSMCPASVSPRRGGSGAKPRSSCS